MQRLETVHIDTLSMTAVTLPSSCVSNAQVVAGANIDAEKVGPQPRYLYAQDGVASEVTGQCIGVIRGTAGTIEEIIAGARVAAVGAATVRIKVKKGATDVLSTALVLSSSLAAYAVAEGTLSVTAVAHDDVLTAQIDTVTSTGTLPSGVFVQAMVYEDAL